MMKRIAMILLTLVLFPGMGLAAAILEGTVVNVDKTKKEIVLKTDKGQESVVFNDATKGAERVKPGDDVRITFTQKGEKLVASEVVAGQGSQPTSAADRPPTQRQHNEKTSREMK